MGQYQNVIRGDLRTRLKTYPKRFSTVPEGGLILNQAEICRPSIPKQDKDTVMEE